MPMKTTAFEQLACPLDGHPLSKQGSSWRCESGHSYDIARQGHTNLLPVQNTRSRNPGDSKQMIDARQRFLGAGFYQPIANTLNKIVLTDIAKTANIIDAGCGAGYYLRQLRTAETEQSLNILGLDISKPAILSAAKQDKKMTWVVASNANIPVLPDTIDRLICMFGFPVYAEFSRVLKSDGQLIFVEAGPKHLQELREIIYPVLKPQKEKEVTHEGFKVISTERISYKIDLIDVQSITDLLTMTPHLFRASAEGKEKAAKLSSLSITIDVKFINLKKETAQS